MPARATRPDLEPEQYFDPEPRPAESLLSSPVLATAESEHVDASERPITAFPMKPATDKSMREKRTTRIDPGVYDAVDRELKRQKRAKKRASSTLSDLLDELLRNWLRTHNVEIE